MGECHHVFLEPLSPIAANPRNYRVRIACEARMDTDDSRNDEATESPVTTPNCLAFPGHRSPHRARRRADGGPALEPRPEAPCPADDKLDPGTKAMCDILVRMAFAKLIRQAGAATAAKER